MSKILTQQTTNIIQCTRLLKSFPEVEHIFEQEGECGRQQAGLVASAQCIHVEGDTAILTQPHSRTRYLSNEG